MPSPSALPSCPLRDVVVFPARRDAAARRAPGIARRASRRPRPKTGCSSSSRSGAPTSRSRRRATCIASACVARIVQATRQANGTARILVEGISRARVTRYVPASGYLRAAIADEPEAEPDDPANLNVVARRVLALFEEYVALHRRIPNEVVARRSGRRFGRPARRTASRRTSPCASRRDRRCSRRRACPSCSTRSSQVLGTEIELLRLERKLDEDVRGSLFQNQREFYLQEQLKAIHRELGQDDTDDVGELERQIEARKLPDAVRTRALREVRKLRRMSPLSPESTVARNFVDWILALPWTERTDDVLDVPHARRVLDEDHYGLEEVKDRILDYIGVLSLVERMEGPILCLVGPPGVGKTSLGRSIARALGRKFVRMSLGGVRDEAEIRGHRRTYIGSMPGRVIQAMRRAEVDESGHPAGRDRQARTGLSRRSVGGAARSARPRAESRVQRSLPRGRLRSVAGAVRHDGELSAAGAGAAARPHGDHSTLGLRRSGKVRDRAPVSRAEAASR